MSLSSSDISALTDWTDAEILKAYRQAMITGAFRTTYTIGGRMLQIPDAATVMKVIGWLEGRINAAGEQGGDTALIVFGEPQP